jgi:hypothetical protein
LLRHTPTRKIRDLKVLLFLNRLYGLNIYNLDFTETVNKTKGGKTGRPDGGAGFSSIVNFFPDLLHSFSDKIMS